MFIRGTGFQPVDGGDERWSGVRSGKPRIDTDFVGLTLASKLAAPSTGYKPVPLYKAILLIDEILLDPSPYPPRS